MTAFQSILRITALLAVMSAPATTARGESLLPPMNGAAADFVPRRAGAEVGASVKITVSGEGMFRLEQPELVAAGVDPLDLTGNELRLFCTTQEVAIRVSNGGLWTPADSLLFFAKPYDGPESDDNVYWLGWGGSGKRMTENSVPPFPAVADTESCDWTVQKTGYAFLQDKYRHEDDSFDHWFLQVSEEGKYTTLALTSDEAVTSQPSFLRMVLYGHSTSAKVNPDHRTRVKFNGVVQADFTYDGQDAVTGICAVSGAALKLTNNIGFRQILQQNLAVDRVFVRELSLSYTRRLKARGDALIFPGKTGQRNYRVDGFAAASDYGLLDVTDPGDPVFLTDFSVQASGGGYAIRFGDDTARTSRYAVCRGSSLGKVEKVEKVTFQDWAAESREADYLILSPTAFLAGAERLVQWRALGGLNGAVVPLSDIYNEFSYGIADAGAIKQFLGYAFHHWQTAPGYVLLAGAGSYDPRGYLIATRGKKAVLRQERIPLHMGPNRSGWTSLDGWYALVNGSDKVVDFALGRLPAQTPAMFSNMVNKIIAFESVPKKNWRRKEALLVADWADASLNGKAISESIRRTVFFPAGFVCTTAYSDDLGEPAVHQIIDSAFPSGVTYVSYLGHGAMNLWGHHIYNSTNAAALRNTHYPIVLMMACRNGALQNPLDGPCMMEALMDNAAGGASACVATTAISYGPSCEAFIRGFLREMVLNRLTRIGDGFLGGLADLYVYNPYTQELLYMNLFADPAMVVNP